MAANNEPTRPIGQPVPAADGTLRAKTTLSPKACRVRARLDVPPLKVMPIIVVPGIMGSNLRASTAKGAPPNAILKPGESAWRPPNGIQAGLNEAKLWEGRDPAKRQKILHGATLEVDPTGPVGLPGEMAKAKITPELARGYGWGEIHWSSYGELLMALQVQFGTFMTCGWDHVPPSISGNWDALNNFDRARWPQVKSETLSRFSMAEIEKLAEFWYPVYGFGYNWLLTNDDSAGKLKSRIEQLVDQWNTAGMECSKVLVVTHSMGGLVARACAKKIPERIAGIVHVCMPTLGAPVCYRRIACGTEQGSPSNGKIDNIAAEKFALIAGKTPAETTAVMAHAPGALELLPTHRYPRPWLFALTGSKDESRRFSLQSVDESPYVLYRNTDPWYRLISPEHVEPSQIYEGTGLAHALNSVTSAQNFHERVLDNYFHPNSVAFYGLDKEHLSYANYTWTCGDATTVAPAKLGAGEYKESDARGYRSVQISNNQMMAFGPSVQDAAGDGTVPSCSGAGVKGNSIETLALDGIDHQGVFNVLAARALTLQLVAHILLKS